ncbi:NACHT domain-containing protein [Streptomyces griseosporeus]|uniref:NACHT domain-containing protein n=1 Tax=Streptomyces griseosporeus TaxID=1910 RepID=UPI0036FD9E81
MKFDLYRLGAREFENLTQVIAVAELGPDVAIYGAGSDGGREATQNEVGDGHYIVLQAKYKEVAASPQAEGTWLIKELRKEFKEWRESDKRGKRPDHLIVATNVTLSATPRTGGMDRVVKVLKEECGSLGIKHWSVWHSENINRFLEAHPGIRTSYAAWILPGDILAALYEDANKKDAEITRAIRSYTPKELLNDRYANLDQAGSADDRTVPLAEVFFDVPIGMSQERNAASGARCLETLIAACDTRHSVTSEPEIPANATPSLNRIVLVGGPGQGKSTVSQFLCQLYRAQLVKDTTFMRNAEVRSAVTQINSQAAKEGLLPKARRWPIKVPLTRLADQLAQGRCTNLFDYLAQRVSEASATSVSANDMRNWLQSFPWLLVLDGLDEVPGSSNRAQVLAQISAFQLEADELNADLVVVATTRPQGYTDEFSPKNFVHYYLTALGTDSALAYARKLADARHGNSTERVSRLMERLERAAAEPSTAHLMATPLQVTIMAVLLDRVGKAPKDRFTLFADYYRVIFERELEKEGAASNLLRDHKTDIDSIHADVGLLLQTRSERSGETESRITVAELDTIIRDRLSGEGHDGEELSSLTSSISKAATHRLVFLVPSRDGEVSFEIRSLQEFWAADALMNCSEEEIIQRLRMLAVSSHWRNVLLFALGNIFAMRRNNLRDSVVALVSELNSFSQDFGSIPRRILTGSRLAVEILNDGMVRAPRYEAILVEESLKLLSLPYSEHVSLLASCINDRGMEIAQDYIRTADHSVWSEPQFVFLAVRAAQGDAWSFDHLVERYKKSTDAEREQIFDIALRYEVPVLLHVAARSLEDPKLTIPLLQQCRILSSANFASLMAPKGISVSPSWLPALVELVDSAHRPPSRPASVTDRVVVRLGPARGFAMGVRADLPALERALDHGFSSEHWLASLYDFCRAPNAEKLAALIAHLGPYSAGYEALAPCFPWVIYYAVQLFAEFGPNAIEMIASGYLGGTSDWLDWEARWRAPFGAEPVVTDVESLRSGDSRFLPLPACRLIGSRVSLTEPGGIERILQVCANIADARSRANVADLFLRQSVAIANEVSPSDVELLYHMARTDKPRFTTFGWFGDLQPSDEWIDLIDRVARESPVGFTWVPYSIPNEVSDAYAGDLDRVGLGRLLATHGPRRWLSSADLRHVMRAWEERRMVLDADDEATRILGVVACMAAPPEDMEDASARLACVARAIELGELMLPYVAGALSLDCEEPSRTLILSLLDLPSTDDFDRRNLYERMVQVQASAESGIVYSRMRPC